jgi:hypothetical protein
MSFTASRPFVRASGLVFSFAVLSNVLLATAFECGAPQAPCGREIPAGTTCPKGPGWCTAGHYCGNDKGDSKCMPLPNNCGKAGNVCCPSNAETPHTSSTYPYDREPFCKDGSTCAYFGSDANLGNNPDIYAGVKGKWLHSCTDGQAA